MNTKSGGRPRSEQSKISDPGKGLPEIRGIGLALKYAPNVARLVIGAFVVFEVAIILLRAGSPLMLILTAAGVILIGVLAVMATKVITSRSTRLLGQVFASIVLLLFLGCSALAMSSFFFGQPDRGALLLAHLLDDPTLLPPTTFGAERHIRGRVRVQDLGQDVLEWQDPPTNLIDYQNDLRKRPAIVLEDGATLTMDPGEHRALYISRLTLRNSAFITNGSQLEIDTGSIVSNDGRIVAFRDSGQPPASGPGRDAGSVHLRVFGPVSGHLLIDLTGESGASGQPGAPGVQGAAGEAGENAASGLFDCRRGPGNGGAGRPGQGGGSGAPGSDGGQGGQILIEALAPDDIRSAIEAHYQGGAGGTGGPGGQGGPGGPGGPGGSSNGLCQGHGANGPAGAPGPIGAQGQQGRQGEPGSLSVIKFRASKLQG